MNRPVLMAAVFRTAGQSFAAWFPQITGQAAKNLKTGNSPGTIPASDESAVSTDPSGMSVYSARPGTHISSHPCSSLP